MLQRRTFCELLDAQRVYQRDNKKMSKSLKNFFTVRDVAAEYGYEPIRFFLISSSYRSPINYSTEVIEQALPRSTAFTPAAAILNL